MISELEESPLPAGSVQLIESSTRADFAVINGNKLHDALEKVPVA